MSAFNCRTTFSSKAFPIVARYADRITKKLEQSNLDEPINVKEYKVLLLLSFVYLLLLDSTIYQWINPNHLLVFVVDFWLLTVWML